MLLLTLVIVVLQLGYLVVTRTHIQWKFGVKH